MNISLKNRLQRGNACNDSFTDVHEHHPERDGYLQALRAMPEVDVDRIRAMQEAIRNGELSLNSNVLANAMMGHYRR